MSPKTFILISALFSLAFLAKATPPLVDQICSKVDNPKSCYKVLNPLGHPIGSNLIDLAKGVHQVIDQGIFSTNQILHELWANEPRDPVARKCFSSCLVYYDRAQGSLQMWFSYLKATKYGFLQTPALDLKTEFLDCDKKFIPSTTYEPPELIEASRSLKDLTSIIIVISDALNGK